MAKRIKAASTRAIKAEFIDCRNYQHSWKAHDVEVDGKVYVESTICTRCHTVRKRRIHKHTGELIPGSSYHYPEGYQVAGGRLDANERGTLRLIGVRGRLC